MKTIELETTSSEVWAVVGMCAFSVFLTWGAFALLKSEAQIEELCRENPASKHCKEWIGKWGRK